MNLHCDKIELYQTPTWVTYMCTMDVNGKHGYAKGPDAKRALYCYLEWCSSRGRKISNNDEEYREMQEDHAACLNHRQEVIRMIENTPIDELKVYAI
jgi:hypothetical protein